MEAEFCAFVGLRLNKKPAGREIRHNRVRGFSALDRLATRDGARVGLHRRSILHPGVSILLSFGVVGFSM